MIKRFFPAGLIVVLALAGGSMISRAPPLPGQYAAAGKSYHLPQPAHVVIVWEENKAFEKIIGNSEAPYINHLAQQGALMTHAYALTHPSQPNYLAFFSGSTHGVRDDHCPYRFSGPNLAASLTAAGQTFTLYAQGLPQTGYAGCSDGAYLRRHNPAVDYPMLPRTNSRPFNRFPQDYSTLPTVAWVIPDLRHDMHSGSVRAGDRWLRRHIRTYVIWARTHNSLLIIAWDEDDYTHRNHIPVIVLGPMVQRGHNTQMINHFSVLRTLEAMYDLAPMGKSANVAPITGIWRRPPAKR